MVFECIQKSRRKLRGKWNGSGGVEGREHGGVVKGPAAIISDTPTLLLFDLHSQ